MSDLDSACIPRIAKHPYSDSKGDGARGINCNNTFDPENKFHHVNRFRLRVRRAETVSVYYDSDADADWPPDDFDVKEVDCGAPS